MKKNKRDVIKLFAASPGDMLKERDQVVRRVVDELNRGLARTLGFVIETVTGDMAAPDFGDPELKILEDIGEYDIFVAIFGRRLGSPTARFPSGTIEEIYDSVRKRIKGQNKRTMLYFKKVRQSTRTGSNMDEQVRELERFQSKIRRRFLYREFSGSSDFERICRQDLTAVIQDFRRTKRPDAPRPIETPGKTRIDAEGEYRCRYWPVWQDAFKSKRRPDWRAEAQLFAQAKSSIKFLTISGRSIFGSEIEECLIKKSKFGDFQFKLLLFDWNALWIKPKMQDERRVTDSDIQTAREKAVGIAKSFLALAENSRLRLEIKLYQEYPVWRMIVLDTETSYVGYYPPGKRGYEGPMFIFDRKDDSGLFYPTNQYFDMLWASSGSALASTSDKRFKLRPLEEL